MLSILQNTFTHTSLGFSLSIGQLVNTVTMIQKKKFQWRQISICQVRKEQTRGLGPKHPDNFIHLCLCSLYYSKHVSHFFWIHQYFWSYCCRCLSTGTSLSQIPHSSACGSGIYLSCSHVRMTSEILLPFLSSLLTDKCIFHSTSFPPIPPSPLPLKSNPRPEPNSSGELSLWLRMNSFYL